MHQSRRTHQLPPLVRLPELMPKFVRQWCDKQSHPLALLASWFGAHSHKRGTLTFCGEAEQCPAKLSPSVG